MIDLRPFIELIPTILESHRRGAVGYARLLSGSAADVYGTADAAGILATISTPVESEATVRLIRSFAEADGSYVDASHGRIHTTATAIGAQYLLGGEQAWPSFLSSIDSTEAIGPFLDGLDWGNPWLASHDAAGALAIASMTRPDEKDWFDAYFGWLDANVDNATGLWPSRSIGELRDYPGLFGNLGCSFHFHFLYHFHGAPIPRASEVVDTCLLLARDTDAVINTNALGYPQLDWAYSAGRAARQSGHRVKEVLVVARLLAARLSEVLDVGGDPLNDLHTLGATVALAAELHLLLPGEIDAGRPLQPITDIRPFI